MLQPLCSVWSSETWMTFADGLGRRRKRAGKVHPIEAQNDVGRG